MLITNKLKAQPTPVYSEKIEKRLDFKHSMGSGGQNLDVFGVGSNYKKEADVSQGCLVPVRWTCGRCLDVLLDLRMKH